MIRQDVDVYMDGFDDPIGHLAYTQDDRSKACAFTYTDFWLDHKNGFDLSPHMPRARGRTWNGGRVRTFPGPIDDSTPDSWGRKLIARLHGKNTTDLDYLLEVSDNARTGALRFKTDQMLFRGPAGVPALTELEDLTEKLLAFEKGDEMEWQFINAITGVAGSQGGARPKVAVEAEGNQMVLAKLPSMRDAFPVENLEVMTLMLAEKAGIDACPAILVGGTSGWGTALVQRFDRNPDGSRIHYISAQTFIDSEEADGCSYTDIAEEIDISCDDPGTQLRELYRRILFGVVVGNFDDHLQNTGFLWQDGGWKLAPAFDINPEFYRQPRFQTAITADRDFNTDIRSALDECAYFNIGRKEAVSMLADITRAIDTYLPEFAKIVHLTGNRDHIIRSAFLNEQKQTADDIVLNEWE